MTLTQAIQIITERRDKLDAAGDMRVANELTEILGMLSGIVSDERSEADKLDSVSANKLLKSYAIKYSAKYGYAPVLSWAGKDRQIAKSILKAMSIDDAVWLLDRYLELDEHGIVEACHPFAWIPTRANMLMARRNAGYTARAANERSIEWA